MHSDRGIIFMYLLILEVWQCKKKIGGDVERLNIIMNTLCNCLKSITIGSGINTEELITLHKISYWMENKLPIEDQAARKIPVLSKNNRKYIMYNKL